MDWIQLAQGRDQWWALVSTPTTTRDCIRPTTLSVHHPNQSISPGTQPVCQSNPPASPAQIDPSVQHTSQSITPAPQ
jgi:hypothetical protein